MNRVPWTGITICPEAVCWVPTRSALHPSVKGFIRASKYAAAALLAGPGGSGSRPFGSARALHAPRLELLAAHVRTNHVHAVVEADLRPEKVMNEFKSYASRELNRLGRDGPDRKRWARHGSTRWLWRDEDLQQALQYVIEEQGEPMALFIAEI